MNCFGCRPLALPFGRSRQKAGTMESGSDSTAWPISLDSLSNELLSMSLSCVGKTRRNGTRCKRPLSHTSKYVSIRQLERARRIHKAAGGEAGKEELEDIAKCCSCNHHNTESQKSMTVQGWLDELQMEYDRREAGFSSPQISDVDKAAAASEPEPSLEPQAPRFSRRNTCSHVGKRRTTETECEICKETLSEGGTLVWCKANCGHQFHKSCFRQWIIILATARIPKDPECPFCRLGWLEERCLCDTQVQEARGKTADGADATLNVVIRPQSQSSDI